MGLYNYKLENILQHTVRCFHYIIHGDFETAVQNARKSTEAIAKAIIYRKKGESLGEEVIQGLKHPILDQDIRTDPSPLNLKKLIDVLTSNKYIENSLKVRFDEIKYGGNIASHDSNGNNVLIQQNDAEVVKNDLYVILKWFYEKIDKNPIPHQIEKAYQGEIIKSLISEEPSNWVEFYHECDQFNSDKNYYLLIAPPAFECSKYELSEIGKVHWKLVFDFDQRTQTEGRLYFETESHRSSKIVNFRSIEEPGEFQSGSNLPVYWFATNGLIIPGQEGNFIYTPIDKFLDWRKKHRKNLEIIIESFLRSLSNKRLIIVSLYDNNKFLNIFHELFYSVPNSGKRFKFIFTTNSKENYETLREEFEEERNVKIFQISQSQIANGISSYCPESRSDLKQRIGFPVPGKDPKTDESKTIGLELEKYLTFLKNGVEIAYKGIENDASEWVLTQSLFAGNTVSWQELGHGKPVERNDSSRITQEIAELLEGSRAAYKYNLYHAPGSGGTTLARMIAFKLHEQFPTIVLKRFQKIETARVISDLSDITQKPVLIIAEAFEVNEDEQDRLLFELASKRRHVVLVAVRQVWTPFTKVGPRNERYGKMPDIQQAGHKEYQYYLMQQMQNGEIAKFEDKFCQLNIKEVRKINIRRISKEYSHGDISPFIYGLTAFEDEFLKLPDYIRKILFSEDLPDSARDVIGYISLIYYYTQQSTPVSLLFNTYAEGDANQNLTLNERFGEESPIHLLIIEETDIEGNNTGRWRPRHALFAREAMHQILVGQNGNKDDWRDFLSTWVHRFIELCGKNTTFLSKELYELLRSLLLVRDYSDAIGKEEKDNFSRCIEDIPSPADRQMIFEELVNQFPREPHFRVHLARFYYRESKEFKKAREQAEAAREFAGHDFNVYHTLGMCIRKEIEYLIENDPTAQEDDIQTKTKEASQAFKESRRINSNNTHAYISNMQLLISVLDYGLKISKLNKSEFLTSKENKWYLDLFDELTELTDSANYVFQQIEKNRQKGSNSDYYTFSKELLKSCEISRQNLIGDYDDAIKRSKSLANSEGISNRPFFRRLTVNLMLAKANQHHHLSNKYKQWEHLPESEILQAIQLLEKNLIEEPSNSTNFRMWFNAIRHIPNPPSVKECIGKINKWKDLSLDKKSSNEAIYYLYLLHAVAAIESGESFSSYYAKEAKYLMELSAKNEGNSNFSFEWYGKGEGVRRVLNHSYVAFNREIGPRGAFTPESMEHMERVIGTIKNIESRQAGTIILDCGLEAFFVPIAGDFAQEDALKSKISCFIGFRYDGLQAWDVKKITSEEELSELKKRNSREKQYEFKSIEFIEEHGEPRVFEGTISSLNNNTFGFIRCKELLQEVFFHKSSLENCHFDDLAEDDPVEFICQLNSDSQPVMKKGRFQAETVWAL